MFIGFTNIIEEKIRENVCILIKSGNASTTIFIFEFLMF